MNYPELSDRKRNRIGRWLEADGSTTIISRFDYVITGESIKTLDDCEWLDSIVISFYMKMLSERSEKNKNTMPKVFAFGTEFWCEYKKQHDYESIEPLTVGKDLFAYDIILVPVHENGNHWTLMAIFINAHTIDIIYYNSLGFENEELLDQLIEYLRKEHLNRKGVRLNKTFHRHNYDFEILQENDFDCGAIICSIAEILSQNGPVELQSEFNEDDMAHFRDIMIYEICSGRMLKR